MNTLFPVICKYILTAVMLIYMIGSFTILVRDDPKRLIWAFRQQILLVIIFHTAGFIVLMAHEKSMSMLLLYVTELLYMIAYVIVFRLVYPDSSRIILSHMMMFLAIGFIILARLNFDKAVRQFMMITVGSVMSILVPRFFVRLKFARRFSLFAGTAGILLLLVVLLLSSRTYGANLTLKLGPFAFQPSEFVKISFVLLTAYFFKNRNDWKMVLLSGACALLHILILVASTDLGGALIYAAAYIIMLYAATGKARYLAAGAGCGMAAAFAAAKLFSHVQTRIDIWKDPWPLFYEKGSQVCNSLLGIASGGFMGTGLYQGSPNLIYVVDKDFIFSAITEEMGAVIGISVILISLSCLLKFIQVASGLYLPFYRLTGIGLSAIYAVQVFLTIGGNIKLIPATGVTLPFVSYGGSSVFSTFILFSIMQELFVKRRTEEERAEEFEELYET